MGRGCVVGGEAVGSCGGEGGTWVVGRHGGGCGWWEGVEGSCAGVIEQLWWVAEVVECNI